MKTKKAKQKLPASFQSDLRAVYGFEFGQLSLGFLTDLARVFDSDASDDVSVQDLNILEDALEQWSEACDKELVRRLRKLARDHPVKCPISLFGTMDFGRLEVAHTKTLAWLLNREGEHGFGDALLEAFLCHVLRRKKPFCFDRVEVKAEQFFRNLDDDDAGRMDILVEGWWEKRANKKPWLVVIEAKIDAPEDDKQLGCYTSAVNRRVGSKKHVHRVFLTPRGTLPRGTEDKWVPVSFSELAAVIWKATGSLRKQPGYDFLRLYVAGILKDILDLPIGDRDDEQNRYKLLGFLTGTQRDTFMEERVMATVVSGHFKLSR